MSMSNIQYIRRRDFTIAMEMKLFFAKTQFDTTLAQNLLRHYLTSHFFSEKSIGVALKVSKRWWYFVFQPNMTQNHFILLKVKHCLGFFGSSPKVNHKSGKNPY